MSCLWRRTMVVCSVPMVVGCSEPSSPTCLNRCREHERAMDNIVRRTNKILRVWAEGYFCETISKQTYDTIAAHVLEVRRRWSGLSI